jgi:hypothetical protein
VNAVGCYLEVTAIGGSLRRQLAKVTKVTREAPAETVQRVAGQLVIDATKSDASDAVVPLPQVTRSVLLAHHDRQVDERMRAGDSWEEHGLVFTTQHRRPIEPRYLNTHFDRIRTADRAAPRLQAHRGQPAP